MLFSCRVRDRGEGRQVLVVSEEVHSNPYKDQWTFMGLYIIAFSQTFVPACLSLSARFRTDSPWTGSFSSRIWQDEQSRMQNQAPLKVSADLPQHPDSRFFLTVGSQPHEPECWWTVASGRRVLLMMRGASEGPADFALFGRAIHTLAMLQSSLLHHRCYLQIQVHCSVAGYACTVSLERCSLWRLIRFSARRTRLLLGENPSEPFCCVGSPRQALGDGSKSVHITNLDSNSTSVFFWARKRWWHITVSSWSPKGRLLQILM